MVALRLPTDLDNPGGEVNEKQGGAPALPVETELKVLLLHGLLHCLGFDHETDDGEMERAETRLRRRWVQEG